MNSPAVAVSFQSLFREKSLFESDNPREEDVVLEMYVDVEIGLKCLQTVQQGMVRGTSVGRRLKIDGEFSNPAKGTARTVMLGFHDGDGIGDAAKRRRRQQRAAVHRRLISLDRREQHHLFLVHVEVHFLPQSLINGFQFV